MDLVASVTKLQNSLTNIRNDDDLADRYLLIETNFIFENKKKIYFQF
jgi:hypothetical protein